MDVPQQGTGRRGWGFPACPRLAGTCWDVFIAASGSCATLSLGWGQLRAGHSLAERLWQAQGYREQMHLLHKELLPGSDLSSWQVSRCL